MSQAIRAFLALDSGILAEDVAGLVSGDDSVHLVGVAEGLELAWRELHEMPTDVVLVVCIGYSNAALHLLERSTEVFPERPVIVLCQDAPAAFVRRVFEVGGEDIVMLPQTPEQIRFAVNKAMTRHPGPAGGSVAAQGRLVVVLGPKGGTGKTLSASNLAAALALRGQGTAIVDLDLQFGDIGLCMGLPPEHTVYDLARAGGTIDADKVGAFLTSHRSGAKVLLAPNRPDQASVVTTSMLQEILSSLRTVFDFTIVDTPPGFTAEVITTIDNSTDLVMIGMLDSLSLKNTKLGLETLELMGYDSDRIRLVLNRAHSQVGISQRDVVAVLGRAPDVFVPSDREIPRSVNEGVPIVLSHPESEAAKAFNALADIYLGLSEPPPTTPSSNGAGRQGLFGRLSGKKA